MTSPSAAPSTSPAASKSPDAGASLPASPTAGVTSAPSGDDLTPTITGTALPVFTTTADDPAVGLAAPVVHGYDYSGKPVSIEPTGRPTLVIFAAHWCPHCDRELPLIQAWIDGGGMPPGIDIVTVSTAAEPTAPNYPPGTWLQGIGWTAPVIADPTNSVRVAYGVAGYPFFTLIDGKGEVIARTSGELTTDQLEALLATASTN